MPQLLFDVYMAEKLSHLFSLYVRKREATTAKDPILSKKKIDKVGRELEKCREIVTTPLGDRGSETWESHLNQFKKECMDLVTSYDNRSYPVNSFGELVTGFIEEANLFLKEARKMFILFGLDKTNMEDMNFETCRREKLLNLCMARLYYPNTMRSADWKKVQEFCTHMMGSCEVSLGKEENHIPSFKEYAPLEVAANKWLKKEEAALKFEPSSEQHEQTRNDTPGMLSTAQSAVVYASSAVYAKVTNSLSGMLGSSSSSTSSPSLILSPSALSQHNNSDSSVHSIERTHRSNSIRSSGSNTSHNSDN